ncbi:MAG: ABC transporter ATP-binding protein, partial [Oscillospiraceae bacterium]|nr:ABC transporter ATP-binding protein [Oscillospiraceae bacterium]
AARSPASLICALVMAFLLNARLSLIFLAIIPFLGCGLYLIVRKAHPVFEKVFETYDGLNNVVQENLNGIRVVKAFVREDHEIKKFTGVSALIYKLFTKAEKYITFNGPLMQFSAYTSMILIAWFGARLIVRGDMTTGDLTGMISYAMMILMSLMMFSMVFVMLTISQASAKRITEVLNEESALRNPEEPVMEVKDGSISFRNVNFSYSGDMNKLCLYDVDLDISSGETVGILGGTGTSKSTLVQLIPRLYDATSGTVSVGGIDVKDYDIRTLRNAVAMVLQKNELFSGTIKENLRWGNENASDQELREACRMAQADSFISEMPDGYDTLIERGGTNVSGGQKQRICIARALLKKPKILILDDSTSAVDTATDAMIRASLREYIPETTKIIIAQRVASVQDADKIIVMDDGRISAVGTHEELLEKSDIYREVFNSQQKGGE